MHTNTLGGLTRRTRAAGRRREVYYPSPQLIVSTSTLYRIYAIGLRFFCHLIFSPKSICSATICNLLYIPQLGGQDKIYQFQQLYYRLHGRRRWTGERETNYITQLYVPINKLWSSRFYFFNLRPRRVWTYLTAGSTILCECYP